MTLAKKIVRLLSVKSIYQEYGDYLKNEELNPAIKYGQKNTTFLVMKSWSKLNYNKYILRFLINKTAQARRIQNKIAIVEFKYIPMELTEKDKNINPLGFQVTGLRVGGDSSQNLFNIIANMLFNVR